jgi:hypothetical protein
MATKTMSRHQNRVVLLVVATLGLSALVDRAAGEPINNPKLLPHVVKAEAPLYPPILQMAHFEGVVHLRVTTDGKRASTITTIDGQALLARAATENVRTWEFDGRAPMTFDTTFEYKLLESECDDDCTWCGSVERPTVRLRLPTEVRVEAEEVVLCDPATTTGDK